MAGQRAPKTERKPKPKEGIEKVYLPPEQRTILNPDGTVKEVKTVHPWEVRATGVKYVKELRGIFKDSAPQMMHESWKEEKAIGMEKITRPDGSVDTVRSDKVAMYRQQPGFCRDATAYSVVADVPWEGSMKRRGLHYSKTIYRDGVATVVEER